MGGARDHWWVPLGGAKEGRNLQWASLPGYLVAVVSNNCVEPRQYVIQNILPSCVLCKFSIARLGYNIFCIWIICSTSCYFVSYFVSFLVWASSSHVSTHILSPPSHLFK